MRIRRAARWFTRSCLKKTGSTTKVQQLKQTILVFKEPSRHSQHFRLDTQKQTTSLKADVAVDMFCKFWSALKQLVVK